MANSGHSRNQSNFDLVPSLLYVGDPGSTYVALPLVFSKVKVLGSKFQSPPMIYGTLPFVAKCY
eukprot:4490058-Heterocapsa_arctica.AAC.1